LQLSIIGGQKSPVTSSIKQIHILGFFTHLDAPLETLPLYVRGGSIFALQKEAINTAASRNNSWCLLVALDDNDSAHGKLFMDDGESLSTLQTGNYFEVNKYHILC
jgi:alpha-glucosidase (family GH31 glycosyl hydrolase)